MAPDIRTILITQTFLGLLIAALLILLWMRTIWRTRGVGWWSFALAAITIGQALIALRGVLPYGVTMLPANLLCIAASLALLYGIGAFFEVEIPAAYGIAALFLTAALLAVFGYAFVDVGIRVVVVNSISLANAVYSVIILFRRADKSIASSARAVGITIAILGASAGLRMFGVFVFPVAPDWVSSSPWEGYNILALSMIEVALAFTLIAMVDSRLRAELSKSAEEKTLLVREMHHRTKNDFALAVSLITLEASTFPEGGPKEALERARDRIQSFAFLHDRLAIGNGTGTVNAGEYVSLIASGLVGDGRRDGGIRLRTNVETVEIPAGTAVSLGLIVNELITNALKHAFPDGRGGRIDLSLSVSDANARLEVADDGIGFGDIRTAGMADGLGMTLVRSLSAQIGGCMERTGARGAGVRTTIRFPLPSVRTEKQANGGGRI